MSTPEEKGKQTNQEILKLYHELLPPGKISTEKEVKKAQDRGLYPLNRKQKQGEDLNFFELFQKEILPHLESVKFRGQRHVVLKEWTAGAEWYNRPFKPPRRHTVLIVIGNMSSGEFILPVTMDELQRFLRQDHGNSEFAAVFADMGWGYDEETQTAIKTQLLSPFLRKPKKKPRGKPSTSGKKLKKGTKGKLQCTIEFL